MIAHFHARDIAAVALQVMRPGAGPRLHQVAGLDILALPIAEDHVDIDQPDWRTQRAEPQLRVPALILTGQAELDRVVPVALTRDYLRMWPHARSATIARCGHLGPITRPEQFADLVARFATESSGHHEQRRRVV